MKYLLFFPLAIALNYSCGRHPKPLDPAHKVVEAKPTAIPNTHVSMVPPPDFTLAGNFTGFRKGEKAAIMVMDLNGGNFTSNTRDFSRAALEEKGFKVTAFKDTMIDHYPAKYAAASGSPGMEAIVAVFGDSSFSVMLTGSLVNSDAAAEEAMTRSMFSAHYDKSLKLDPMASAKFTLDDKRSQFKFATYANSSFIYTLNGQATSSANNDGSNLIITQVPASSGMDLKEINKLVIGGLEKQGFSTKSQSPLKNEMVNDYAASEVTLQGTLKGKPVSVYSMNVIKDSVVLMFVGMVTKDFEPRLTDIRNLAHTVRFKEK